VAAMAVRHLPETDELAPRVEVDLLDGVALVRLAGEIDLHASDLLEDAFATAVDRSQLVVVDLTAVRFFDSSALSSVLALRRRLIGVGGNLVIVVDGHEAPRVFRITGLDRIFPLVSTAEEAVAAVRTVKL
jgi:anti-sigma B factor antagonist